MARYKVELETELPNGKKIRDQVVAKSEKHLESIRRDARRDAPRGSTQQIKTTKV